VAEDWKVTRQRHFHRTVVIAASSALFAVAATGSALAWNGTSQAAPSTAAAASSTSVAASTSTFAQAGATMATALRSMAPATRTTSSAPSSRATAATPAPTPVPAPASAKAAASTRTTSSHATQRTTVTVVAHPAAVTAAPAHAPSDGTAHLTIGRYVDAPGSQRAIDKCNLVLWTHHPFWLAAHNFCGYQWLAFVATGTRVTVPSGAAAGTYVVTGHVRLNRQSGALPSLSADLVLQTCVGRATGLTLLRRV